MPRFFYLQCKNNQIFAIDKKIPEKIKKIKKLFKIRIEKML